MASTQDARSAVVVKRDTALLNQHYEVWAGRRTNANIVGGARASLGALTRYVRTRRTERARTINVLGNGRCKC